MKEYLGIIGGSGLETIMDDCIAERKELKIDTPFGPPSSDLTAGTIGKTNVLFINRHGKGHRFNPSNLPYAANIFALKAAGAKAILATGAVGSLQQDIHPGQLVIVDQFIDKTFKRETSFFSDTAAVHCEMANPCCDRLRDKLIRSASQLDIKVHHSGTYVCMEGPDFSTVAEANMHRAWGGDLIGMTAMPEAKLARQAQMCYCLIAMVSDYDCWKPVKADKDKQSLLKEIIGNLKLCSQNTVKLMQSTLNEYDNFCDDKCPCRRSLELAFWSDKKYLDKDRLDKLKILFD